MKVIESSNSPSRLRDFYVFTEIAEIVKNKVNTNEYLMGGGSCGLEGPEAPPLPRNLSVQLTLFTPDGAYYPSHITAPPPD